MGDNPFWDKNQDLLEGSGGEFLNKAEKDALAQSGQPFDITGVRVESPSRWDKDRDDFIATVVMLDEVTGESVDRAMRFAKDSGVITRDKALERLQTYFEADETAAPVSCKLDKAGAAFLLVPAERTEA